MNPVLDKDRAYRMLFPGLNWKYTCETDALGSDLMKHHWNDVVIVPTPTALGSVLATPDTGC